MKDQQLFQQIKTIIKQKHSLPKDSEPMSFAERYCKQQLLKKKLNPYNAYSKMTSLLKDFQDLDTYVDLPQLIASIKQMRFRTKQSISLQEKPKLSFLNANPTKQKKQEKSLHKKIKKQLGQKIKQKYLSDNTFADQLLRYLENSTSIKTEGLKNNSYNNLNNLLEEVERDGEDQTTHQTFQALQILNSNFNRNNQYEEKDIQKVNAQSMYMGSQLNSKSKKQQKVLLHKISTYLQIILQTEHKRKWGTKKFKTHKIIPTQKQLVYKNSSKQKVNNTLSRTFRKQFSNDKCLQLFNRNSQQNQMQSSHQLRDQLKRSFYKENQLRNQSNYNFKRTTTSFQLKTVAHNTNVGPTPNLSKHQSSYKTSFHQGRLPSVLQQRTKDVNNLKLNKEKVKENFTFRNRNVKQKIVNKLNKFIREIDEQEHHNKKQNTYYTTAINKLQSTLSSSFGQFKPQNLAQDNDIQNLTRYATYFKHGQMNPMMNNSNNWAKMLSQNTNPIILNFDLQQSDVNQNSQLSQIFMT